MARINRMFLVLAALVFNVVLFGQDTSGKMKSDRNPCFIHFYPSALVAGDMAMGFEHVTKRKFGLELSLNYKCLPSQFYYFEKGVRADVFFKYRIYTGKKFLFSSLISFSYRDIYFNGKQVNYYYVSDSPEAEGAMYQILLEDRRRLDYGAGIGISFGLQVYRRLFIGADLVANVVKQHETFHYREVLYRDPGYAAPHELIVPSGFIRESSGLHLSPLARIKFSYSFAKD